MTGSPTVLALSPHLDDAAFSAGATLAALARGGAHVVVATLFTRSVPDPQGFALACQLDKGLSADIDYMALRRHEDSAACALLGAEARWLPFPEAPHRGYDSAPALFAAMHDDDAIVGELTPALQDLVRELRPAVVLAPQAVGGHVDHVAAVEALAGIETDACVAWWYDYPYAVRDSQPKMPFAERFAQLDEVTVRLGDADRAAKEAAALAYRSQIGFQFGGPAQLRARLEHQSAERFRTANAPAFPAV